MKVLLDVILIVTLVFVGGNEIASAQPASRKFFNPQLRIIDEDGSSSLPFYIAGCVTSDRFANVCGDDARQKIGLEACKHKGYSRLVSYGVTDLGWRNRRLQWSWEDNDRGNGNFRLATSSFKFTSLECSN